MYVTKVGVKQNTIIKTEKGSEPSLLLRWFVSPPPPPADRYAAGWWERGGGAELKFTKVVNRI
jgi:hypothetical protein